MTDDDVERLRERLRDARNVWVTYRRTADVGQADDRVLDLLRSDRPQLRADLLYGKTMWLYRFGPAVPAAVPAEPASGTAAVPQAPSELPSAAPAPGERAGP